MHFCIFIFVFLCLMSVWSILFVAKALAYIANIEWFVILGVGPLLVRTVLVVSSFGTVSMGLFCRHILFTKVTYWLWQQLPAITGCSLLVLMVRYKMLVLFGVENYISSLSILPQSTWLSHFYYFWNMKLFKQTNVLGITLLPDTSGWNLVASFT